MSAELRIESDAVSVWRAHSWLVAVTAGLVVAFMASPLFVLVGLLLFLGYYPGRAFAGRARPAAVSVVPGDAGVLILERKGKIARFELAKVTDCWHWPDARGVNVVVATRKSMVSIQVKDRESAATLSKALGVDTTRQLVGTTLTAAPVFTSQRWRQFVIRQLSGILVVLGIPALLFFLPPLVAPISAAAGVATLFAIVFLPAIVGWSRDARSARVLVGRDGVLLSSFGRREFVGYERIKHVRRAPFAITLTLTNDEIVLLPLSPQKGARSRLIANPIDSWTRDPGKVRARRQALAEQIDAALQRFRNSGTAAAALGRVLERGPRSIEEWRESLTRAAAGGYRETHVDGDLLLDIVESPRAPIGQRLGAALALTRLPDDATTEPRDSRDQRIRSAIASSANPRVRIALEQAAEGTLDDATYERALDAEASSEKAAAVEKRA
jgi:hypothetical protein